LIAEFELQRRSAPSVDELLIRLSGSTGENSLFTALLGSLDLLPTDIAILVSGAHTNLIATKNQAQSVLARRGSGHVPREPDAIIASAERLSREFADLAGRLTNLAEGRNTPPSDT
jgi:hypothetical protein